MPDKSRQMRHRRIAIALSVAAVALALVLAFPGVAARIVADRLGTTLGTRVHVGWITWNPLRARWTLANLRVAADRGPPALAARRVMMKAHLWDLLNARYRVRTVALTGSRVRLRATPAGWELPLPARSAAPSEEKGLPTLQVDWASAPRVVVSLEPGTDMRSVLRTRQLEAMATLEPDRTQAMLWTRGRLDRGSIALVGRVRTSSDAHRLRLRIAAEDLDVARVLRLASGAPVRDLRGRLNVRGKYHEHGTGGHVRRAASGSLSGEDVALGARGVDAIWTRSFALSRFDLDLDKHRVVLGTLRLREPETWIRRTEAGFALPAAAGSDTTAAGADQPAWTVSAQGISITGGAVHVADVERAQQLDIGVVTAHIGPVAGAHEPIPLEVDATLGAGGRASAKGDVVREPLSVRMHLDVRDLALPPLVQFARTPLALESGRLSSAVDVRVAEKSLEVAGSLHVQDVKTVSADPARPEGVLAFKDLRVGIRRVRTEPISIDLVRVELEWPYVPVDRTPSGIFPWTLIAPRAVEGADVLAATGPPPKVHLDRLDVMGGRIDFRDATLEPPYWRSLAAFKLLAEGIDAPPLRVASSRATALIDELSPLRVEGTIGERTRLVADVEKLALPPFNAYLEGAAPYTLSSGTVSAHSEIVLERSALEVQNRVVLSRLGLKGAGGEDFIQREVGLPLTLALALMKDYRGNIELGLPFGGNLKEPTFSMRSVVLQAIVRTVRGAVLSPLNTLGRVILRDGRIEQFDLDPIPFAAGSRTSDAAGRERVQQIARVLEAHPNLVLRVRGQFAQADVDHLRDEAALAALIDDPSAEKLREPLRARLAGAPPPALDRQDGRRLDDLLAAIPWPADALRALAVDRGAVAAASFILHLEINPARVAAQPPAEPRPESLAPMPSAAVELRER